MDIQTKSSLRNKGNSHKNSIIRACGAVALIISTSPVFAEATIGTTDIFPQAVTAGRIAENAVTSSRIQDGSIRNEDISNLTITEAKLSQSLQDKINKNADEICVLYKSLNDTVAAGLTIPEYCVWYAIGDSGPAGGIVFYTTDGGLHGLEAAPEDQANAPWGCMGIYIPGSDGVLVGTGARNTANIIAGCAVEGIAAKVAAAYGPGWFLPSRDELNLLYGQKDIVGGLVDGLYWSSSSTAISLSFAWYQNFNNGDQFQSGFIRGNELRVRSLRAF